MYLYNLAILSVVLCSLSSVLAAEENNSTAVAISNKRQSKCMFKKTAPQII